MIASGNSFSSVRTSNTREALIDQLERIWSEIGESESDKEHMLLAVEREYLEIYQRKVDEAANAKACLHQSIAAKEAEIATLLATLGETYVVTSLFDKKGNSLKAQVAIITPLLEDLKLKKMERIKQFTEIKSQIDKITCEISGYGHVSVSDLKNLEEQDLSLKKLMEYRSNLRSLQKNKSERLQKLLDYVNEVHTLSNVLSLDFGKIVSEVHPSLHGSSMEHVANISDDTLERLDQAISRLKAERKFRSQKMKVVAKSLYELWNLMDVPKEDTVCFLKYTSILGYSECEIVQQGALSMEVIEQVSAEVERLTKLKAIRLKELVTKKRLELEDICSNAHIRPDPTTSADKINALIDSGLVDPSELLANIESQIYKAKDEAMRRKEIMDKIERWLSACDEEKWLQDYDRDENRYSVGRGAHINLKRAEKARITVNKITVIVDNLIRQTLAWEHEKHKMFLYDEVRLVSILEDYKKARRHKEEEKKRARDEKKLQDILLTEKESIYGSKPSPRRNISFKKLNGYNHDPAYGVGRVTPRRNSTSELLTPRSYSGRQSEGYFRDSTTRRLYATPLNFVAIPRQDTMSFSSVCGSEPESPPQG